MNIQNIFDQFFHKDDAYIPAYMDKQYLHFDMEQGKDYIERVFRELKSTGRLNHSFYPLIRYNIPKYKKCKDTETGKYYIDKSAMRPIMHTARTDAMIYAYYRAELMNKYEKLLVQDKISDHVIAYRRIDNQGFGGNKCNVHFANEAIDEIINRENCCAIAMDISGFFDNLDHKIIKKQWLKVIGGNSMPSDHYKIYKNITKYRHVDAKKLEDTLKIKLKDLQKLNRKLRQKNEKPNIRLLKDNKEFRNLIIPNLEPQVLKPKGIPQGTTISDVIANMYLIDFDKKISNLAQEHNWYYRRYSDDILIICTLEEQQKAIDIIKESITKECLLEVKDTKTLFSNFIKTENAQECKTYKYDNVQKRHVVTDKPFEYLGLSFNGTEKRIRNSTISKFYQKLKQRIIKEVKISKNKLAKNGIEKPTFEQLYKKTQFIRIYDDYLGKYTSKNYQKEKIACTNDDDIKKLHDDWRNFYSYVELVAKVTDDKKILDIFNPTIKWMKKTVKEECNKIVPDQE